MNLIFQKYVNILFEVHDPTMVLRYPFSRVLGYKRGNDIIEGDITKVRVYL